MKKRIVYIVESFATGVFTYLVDLTNGLSDKYDFLILYGKRDETPKDFKKYFNNNVKFIEIKNLQRKISIKDIKALKEIKEVLKKEKYDIIHLHSSKAGALGRIGIHNKVMFYTPHSYAFLSKNILKNILFKIIEVVLSKINNCKTIACSKDEYIKTIKFNKNSTYVDNGVNIDYLSTIPVNKSKMSICTCGRIIKQKNPKLFNEIAESFPDIDFIWIGDGPDRNLLTSKNIKVTGFLKRKEALKELVKHDVFILPSIYEGLSIGLLESMYLKRICIVSNISSNKYIIDNNLNGFICKNKEDYINTINNIINKKYTLEKIKREARKDIIKNYNIKKMCEKYEKIYEEN